MNQDEIDIAYDTALALAAALLSLGQAVNLPDPAAGNLRMAADLVVTVLAPAMTSREDIAAIAGTIADQAYAAQRAVLQVAGGPRDAASGFYQAATAASAAVPFIASPGRKRAAEAARALAAAAEAAFLAAAFVCEANSDFADRQSATDARARIVAAMDASSDRIAADIGGEVFEILAETSRQASDYLVTAASELRPVVRIEAMRSFPSTYLAWLLYGDPQRAEELAARNRCGTPLFMPATFEALSPGAG